MSDALSIRLQHQMVLSGTYDAAIMVEILSWLPVKSLLRFRCVCKAWRALISEPYFINKHLSHTRTRSSFNLIFTTGGLDFRSIEYQALLNCLNHDGPVPSRELDFPVTDPPFVKDDVLCVEIVGACNGLICLFCHLWGSFPTVMLWNPCTRDFLVLPQPPISPVQMCFYGFGYDSTIDDYKVILGGGHEPVLVFKPGFEYYVVVFTLKTGSWKKLESLTTYYDVHSPGAGYLVNEALHWVLMEGEYGRPIFSRMVSFNLAEEKFHEIPFSFDPNPADWPELVAEVGILNNCLTLYFQTMYRGPGCKLKMWVMKEYGVKESWTEVIELPSGILGEKYECIACISENGELLVQDPMQIYNPMEKKFRRLSDDCPRYTATYVESLVSPLTGSTSGTSL